MAVSNPATMSSVYAEFGAPAGTPLSAFLRGGSYVPNVAANAAVPTALPIRLAQLAGAVKYIPITVGGPTTASGSVSGPPTSQNVVSNIVTMNYSGGNPGATASWSYVSGAADVTPVFGSGFTQQWQVTINTGQSRTAVWRCTVTDGVSSNTRDVTVTLSHTA